MASQKFACADIQSHTDKKLNFYIVAPDAFTIQSSISFNNYATLST